MQTDKYPECVFNSENVVQKPPGSRFFLGETVLNLFTKEFYTVCDLGSYTQDYYGLWPLGLTCAVPTHGAHGKYLQSIAGDEEKGNPNQRTTTDYIRPDTGTIPRF